MRIIMVFITISLVILATIMSFIFVNMAENGVTGSSIVREYTYTKAICDDKICQDTIIACTGNTMTGQTPIAGAVINHEPNWVDPRDEKTINTFCQ